MTHSILHNPDYCPAGATAVNTDHSTASNLISYIIQYPATYCAFYLVMRATNVFEHLFLLIGEI